MATFVVVPQAGLEVESAAVLAIHVEAGERVEQDAPLVELETDKAVSEVLAPAAGVILAVLVQVGDDVPVGGQLIEMAYDGDAADTADTAAAVTRAAITPAPPPGVEAAPDHEDGGGGVATLVPAAVSRRRVAPVARRAARELGIDLDAVAGTGPHGRVTLRDVKAAVGNGAPVAAALPAAAAIPAVNGVAPGRRREALSATRKVVARRMTQSAQIPQYALDRRIDATTLLADKRALARAVPGVSVTDLLVQAQAEMLARHPDLACAFVDATASEDAHLLHPADIDVGLAIAAERGLVVAVLRRAGTATLGDLVAQRRRLVETARAGRLGAEDMTGATTTLSNLGSFGVDRFAAMLNPGETTILAVGQTVDHVMARGLAVVPTLTLTLTVDHRVADGATGARALDQLAALLQGDMRWRV